MLTLLLKVLWLGGTNFISMGWDFRNSVPDSESFPHILSLGLELLWLGRTLYLLGLKIDSKFRTANLSRDSQFSQRKA
jgi:hypothetical protein